MLPDLTVLVALVVGLASMQETPVDPLQALLGTLASVAVGLGMIGLTGERGVRAARMDQPAVTLSALRWITLWPLIAYGVAAYALQWGALVVEAVPRAWWLARYAVAFVPAVPLFLFAWVQRGRLEEAVALKRGAAAPTVGPRAAIRQGLRRNGIALLPLPLLLGLLEGIWLLGEWGVPGFGWLARWTESMPLFALGLMLAVLAGLSFFVPALFRRLLKTEPLPAGPLRTALENQARGVGLRYREILLWRTDGRVMNAMVVGFTPRSRLVFLTDGLLRSLPEEEVLAVFSHEAGHARRHHLPLLLTLFIASAVVFHILGDALEIFLGLDPLWITAAHLAFLWFVILGSVSRFFEREADVFGADHAADLYPAAEPLVVPHLAAPLPAGAAWMARALERIRGLTGKEASHRHGPISSRVAYVATYATDERVRKRFRASRRQLLGIIAGGVLLAVALVAWRLPSDLALGRAWMASEEAASAYQQAVTLSAEGRGAEARPLWETARTGFLATVDRLGDLSEPRAEWLRIASLFNAADTALHGQGNEAEAQAGFERLLATVAASDLPPEATADVLFQAHVDLGRILAHQNDAQAFAYWQQARRAVPRREGKTGAWIRARVQLLRTTLLARVDLAAQRLLPLDVFGLLAPHVAAFTGGEGRARELLEALAERGEDGVEWDELRRDARAELDRLP